MGAYFRLCLENRRKKPPVHIKMLTAIHVNVKVGKSFFNKIIVLNKKNQIAWEKNDGSQINQQ